ncbi:MAG: hypothetical protein GKS07_10960 [Nitrosopumilus sp.]|nr:MAG: hypothetical protein GKS07_00525 [Nitrosopumilus sp.]QMU55361.1 MAG: hypothetical protein GKS07_10960 [Nitrosopumilus sp.]
MTIEFRNLPQKTIAFAANEKVTLAIPRVNAIRWIDMRFFITNVAGGSDPTEIQDTILNAIKKIKLILDDDDTKINVDARKLFFVEKLEKGTEPATNKDDNQVGSETKIWFVQLRLDFAKSRLRESDISALLPARLFTKLDLEIEWGDVNDMFSANPGTITVADSGCKIQIREVFDTENKVAFAKGQANGGFDDFRLTTNSVDIDATHTNLTDDALESSIRPGNRLISKHFIMTKNSSGDRVDDAVEKLLLEDTRGSGRSIVKSDWDMLNGYLKAEYQLESLDAGIAYLDYIDVLGKFLAIDAESSLMWKIQNIAPTGTEKFEVLTKYFNGKTLVKPANA